MRGINRDDDDGDDNELNSTDVVLLLYGDVLSRILSYLPWYEVINCRCVSTLWKHAAYHTRVKHMEVDHPSRVSELHVISQYIPQLQSLHIDQKANTETIDDNSLLLFRSGNDDGNDDYRGQQIDGGGDDDDDGIQQSSCFLSRFFHLKALQFVCTDLHLSMPRILQLSQLRFLNLHGNERIVWKLSDLRSLPHLVDLRCVNNKNVTGDLRDFVNIYGKYNDTFKIIGLSGCNQITGNFYDLSKFNKLEILFIDRTDIVGDVRDVKHVDDFVAMQQIGLDSKLIYGASSFDSVHHAKDIMQARHQLTKRSKSESPIYPFRISLSQTSPDYFERIEQRLYSSEYDPPFHIEYVIIGEDSFHIDDDGGGGGNCRRFTRRGWRWSNTLGGFGNVNWLDSDGDDDDDDDDDHHHDGDHDFKPNPTSHDLYKQ